MPQIAPPTQPTVSVQVPVPTPVEPAPRSQPAAARPNQDFLDGYAAALQQQGKGKPKDEEPPADRDAKPAAVSLPPPQPDTDRRQQVVPHALIFPYLPPPRRRFRPQARYARASVLTGHPEVQSLLRNVPPGGRGLHDPLPHGIAADRIEEAGFPAIARHIRESAAGGETTGGYGRGAEDSVRDYTDPTRSVVGGGQPAMHVSYAIPGDEPGTVRVHLRLPTGNGFYRAWSSPVLTQQQAAKRVREMAAEGVALMRYPSLHRHRPVGPPGGTDTGRALNTDAKAARRYARYRDIAAHPDNVAFHRAIAEGYRSGSDDLTPHLVYADWLEDHGHAGMAQVIRHAVARTQQHRPKYADYPLPGGSNPIAALSDDIEPVLLGGQPAVRVWGTQNRGEQIRNRESPGVMMKLFLPDVSEGAPHFARGWETGVMTRGQGAALMRQLKADGVAHWSFRTHPGGATGKASNLDTRQRPNWKVDAAGEGYTTRPPEPPTRFRKRKYAAQRAWATWQSLHPEIRHTPLGAALVHVANGHGGDETATHLAYAAVHAAGEHDSPMKLEPIGVLADYLEDNNPGHPLARAFNLNGITNKLELDRLVEAHAAQMAAGEMGVSPGHDWTRSKLGEIRAGHPLHTRQGPPNDLQRAVAAVHAAGVRASDDDVYRSAGRVAQRRYKNTASSQAIWHPDDYHAAIGRQVMDGHDVVEADDPNRFSRAVAASIGASQ